MWLLLQQRPSGKLQFTFIVFIENFIKPNQAYLVTGGQHGGTLSSTEILTKDASQWTYAGPLPSARNYYATGATLGDKLIMIGEMMMIVW